MTSNTDLRISERLLRLQEKYGKEGKDMSTYLEKLIQEKSVDYTDYLNLDTLLTLQKSRSDQPDEMIFIVYHQIVELYFRLIIWELEQLTDEEDSAGRDGAIFLDKVIRINRYLSHVVGSFAIMLEGLDKEQFQKFRTTLFPASGFQSYQYRQIELYISDLKNLVASRQRGEVDESLTMEEQYNMIYWKRAMYNHQTKQKRPTLLDFEERYDCLLLEHAENIQHRNLWQQFERNLTGDPEAGQIIVELRRLDQLFNVQWAGMHFRVAMKYLTNHQNTALKSTGGSAWGKYLQPKFQRLTFFPKLYRKDEMEQWGHAKINP